MAARDGAKIRTKAVELGDKDSASALVSLYRYGGAESGHYKDASKAAAILQSLASGGDAVSQATLAELYMSGEGVEWDNAKAFEWLLKAAAQDYAYAEMEIADIFEYGLGGSSSDMLIEPDHALAEAWRARATVQGYTVYRPDSP